MLLRSLPALIGFLLITPAATAQVVTRFTNYTNDDGLPQSTVWRVGQDKNGFIWAGTADGICRFDGYTFHKYKTAVNNARAIISDRNCSFYTDHAGNLWIASFKGLSLYNPGTDDFTNYLTYQPVNGSVRVNRIYGEDSTYIWAGMGNYGLVKVDKVTRKVYRITKAGDKDLSSRPEWYGGFVDGNNVWFCDSLGSLISYNTKTGGFHRVNLGFNARTIANLNDTILIAENGSYIFFVNKLTGAITRKNCNLGAGSIEINDMLVYNPAKVMLATTRGIYYVNTLAGSVDGYLQNFEKENKKKSVLAENIFKDRSGNIWVGTNGTGLAKISYPFKKFKYYASPNAASNIVKSIYADSTTLYTGYFDNGMDIFNRSSGFVKNVTIAGLPHGAGNHVYSIIPNTGNSLLLYVANQNLLCTYNKITGKLQELYQPVEKAIPGYQAKTNKYCFFTLVGDNRLLTGFNDYLLSISMPFVYNTLPEVITRFNRMWTCTAWQDKENRVWLGTVNGMYYYDGGKWQPISLPEDVEVKTINQDDDGNIWAGTLHGIYTISPAGKVLQHYSEATGLLNQVIYGILKDDGGNMWFSTNKGIGVYYRTKKTFRYFTKEDGLQGNEFNTGAYFKAADGELFFGGINGTNSFYPRDILDNPNTPQVRVTAIKLFDEPYNTTVPGWQVQNITLPYNNNTLSFEFAMPEYTNTVQNQYACMMVGIDKDWIHLGAKNTERYAGLAPGHYTFKVKGANNDGIWTEQPTIISINIVPPYWQRTWFRVLYSILAAGLVAVIVAYLQKRRYKRKLAALELQQKIQVERERISRDLHDNVGTQLSLISKSIDEIINTEHGITESEKNKKMLLASQRSTEVIDTLRETIWALSNNQITLEAFGDRLKYFVQKQLEPYDTIAAEFNEDEGNAAIVLSAAEALNLFRISQEVITNALKYSAATLLSIHIRNTDGKYCLSITDNGTGFDTSKVNTSFHFGLENIKYRAGQINSQLEVSSQKNSGTTVTLCEK